MSQKLEPILSKRRYPPFYERVVPIAIGVLAIIIVGMLIFTVAVALGLIL